MVKNCLYCGNEFQILRSKYSKKYCSPSCASKHKYKLNGNKYPNEYFKEKRCIRCGVLFIPKAPSQKYCSTTCRGKNSYYLRNYNITEDDLKKMKVLQNNRCFICGSKGFLINSTTHTETLVVDHCHATGAVRKLLCHNCNRALGLFQDNPDLLRKAAEYIEGHRKV